MKDILDSFSGRKTYIVVIALFALLFASWQGWCKVPTEVYAALLALAMGFLRAGVAKAEDAASTAPFDAAATLDPRRQAITNSPQARPVTGGGTLPSVLLVLLALSLLLLPACLTKRVTTVTPAGTNSQGVLFSPVTNTTDIVNTNNLALDCAGLQVATAIGVSAAVLADTNSLPALHDAESALGGIITGAGTNSTVQILQLLGQTTNPALAAEIAPIVGEASTLEQSLLAKYSATVSGQITLAIAKAVYSGLLVGLAGR